MARELLPGITAAFYWEAIMNLGYIQYNLKQAREELDAMINGIKKNADYEEGEYVVAMTHLYHHINTAWNARDVSKERSDNCSEEDFKTWRRFPKEDELFLEA